jgi:hypothetical protein
MDKELPRGLSHILVPALSRGTGSQVPNLLEEKDIAIERTFELTDERGMTYTVYSVQMSDVSQIIYELAKNGVQGGVRGINADPTTRSSPCHGNLNS